MKNSYLVIGIVLLFFDFSFSQSEKNKMHEMDILKEKIVQKINTPEKIWINGFWKINTEGHRIWEKGYWQYQEKTFQEKSQILRRKLNDKHRV